MAYEQILFWVVALVQVLGLAAMLLYRIERVVAPGLAQGLFVAALLLVGAGAVLTFCCHDSNWLSSGVTLCLMAVGGTIEVAAKPMTF